MIQTDLPDGAASPLVHGMVPIAEARSFQWAGWWIAVVDGSDSALADGPQRQVAALAFGTPPGVVLSPQELLAVAARSAPAAPTGRVMS